MHVQFCSSAGARPGFAGDAFTVCDSGMQPGQLVQLAHILPEQSVAQDIHCETRQLPNGAQTRLHLVCNKHKLNSMALPAQCVCMVCMITCDGHLHTK